MVVPLRFKISPLEAVVLLHHVVNSDDAENDADRTVAELVEEIDGYRRTISKSVMESALYCCNMMDEKGKFWHPQGLTFEKFIYHVIPSDLHYDRYYSQIYATKRPKETAKSP